MNTKLKNFIISLLRKGSYKWKPRQEARKAAKVQVGTFSTGRPKYKYKCNMCHELFAAKDVVMDHVKPVVPLDNSTFDLNDYAERMFCEEDGFQSLCGPCHDTKTKEENKVRTEYKRSLKKDKK